MKDFVPIEGYEGLYYVSREGEISNGKIILKTYIINSGYKCVKLVRNKKRKTYLVHRIVAKTFINNEENLSEVNHIDGDKMNNSAKNLEWVCGKRNMAHAKEAGLWEYNVPTRGLKMSSKSKYYRVGWDENRKKWYSSISINNRPKDRKRFNSEIEAAKYADYLLDKYEITDRPRNFSNMKDLH